MNGNHLDAGQPGVFVADMRHRVPGVDGFRRAQSTTEAYSGECSMRSWDRRYALTARIWASEGDCADDDRRAACELVISVTDEGSQEHEKRSVSVTGYEYYGSGYGAHLASLAADGSLFTMWRETVSDESKSERAWQPFDEQVANAIWSISLGNNGHADIGNDDALADAVAKAGYVVIRTRNLHGRPVYRGFTKQAQENLRDSPFGVSMVQTNSLQLEHEGPDYEAMILARQAVWQLG
ncbi:hypothetical protein [Paraburkholderia sp. J8-2]|uniref:hypothetical protein n=1 Tax=Paraburkholderia sp. J8-2 TaxID=2805440 RepID=UPI002AB6EC87|nr:hypothetical protein [Paraburkholderia sp. J8-2]